MTVVFRDGTKTPAVRKLWACLNGIRKQIYVIGFGCMRQSSCDRIRTGHLMAIDLPAVGWECRGDFFDSLQN
jgi:hypothetical protein